MKPTFQTPRRTARYSSEHGAIQGYGNALHGDSLTLTSFQHTRWNGPAVGYVQRSS